MTNFRRGIDPKEVLQIGIPTYEIHRMQEWRSENVASDDIGFHIIEPNRTIEILSSVSEGRIPHNLYLIKLRYKYDSLGDRISWELSKMPLCFISYCGNKYLMDFKKVLKKDT
jgi:hypothetical protein